MRYNSKTGGWEYNPFDNFEEWYNQPEFKRARRIYRTICIIGMLIGILMIVIL